MIRCPSCQRENAAEAAFCDECGARPEGGPLGREESHREWVLLQEVGHHDPSLKSLNGGAHENLAALDRVRDSGLSVLHDRCFAVDSSAGGSPTFTYNGDASDGTTIRIGVASSVQDVEFTMDISGNDKNQASARLQTQLLSRGVVVQRVSPNSLDVLGNSLINQVYSPITEIAGGSTQVGFPVRLDGSDVAITRNLKPGSTWRVAVEPRFAPCQAVAGGSETVSLQDNGPNSLVVLSTDVPSCVTPDEAAMLFYNLLVGGGLPDVGIDGTEVSFLSAPFDGSLLIVPNISDLAFDIPGMVTTLTFPETVPEPRTLLLVVTGLFILAGSIGEGARRQSRQPR